ncbi:MAG: LptF/LptG family permease [Spirochaetales bacterium]|nr:LptF/LptG family permease [Spirochaetales bacterium]
MKTFDWMLVRNFLAIFLVTLLFFVLLLELFDVFANLWRYLAQETTLAEILRIGLYYAPKCLSYSISPALLFSVAFTLGTLYRNNELIAIIGSGVSLYRLVVPFFVIGLALSAAGFLFEEHVVIETYRVKNELYNAAVRREVNLSNTNVTVMSADARTIYHADYYNDKRQTITDVVVLWRDPAGRFAARLDADWGEWNDGRWTMHNCVRYVLSASGREMTRRAVALYDSEELAEPPQTFRKTTRDVEEMKATEAREWVATLRRAGLPYREALTEYYTKYFFAFTPFVVVLLAAGLGGWFRRNVLLMNLLAALIATVVYYVAQMIASILAKNGYLPPAAGASLALVIVLAAGGVLLRKART